MTPLKLFIIDALSVEYQRAIKRGDRAFAKRLADEMRAIRNAILKEGPTR
jgi:hypothetical protein